MARNETPNYAARRIADYSDLTQTSQWFPVAAVRLWFEDPLKADDPRPSQSAYENFADDVRRAINRVSNYEKQKVDRADLKDVVPAEWFQEKMAPVLDAAHCLALALGEFEKSAGNYVWREQGETETISLEQLIDQINLMRRSDVRPSIGDTPPSGRPPEAWHKAAHRVAALVRAVYRGAGFERNLTATDEVAPSRSSGRALLHMPTRRLFNLPDSQAP